MDSRKVRKIWQLIYDAFWFIPVEAIKSKIYSHRGNQINQSRRWQITFWLSPCSLATLSWTWPPRDPPPSQGLSLTSLPATEKTHSDRWSSWHWEDHLDELGKKGELRLVMLPSFQWWFMGSPLVGFYLHTHFAMTTSRLSPKYLQTLDAHFFGTTLFFWMGGMAVDQRDNHVLIIFQFFVNNIWITKHSLFNNGPLYEMELQKGPKN